MIRREKTVAQRTLGACRGAFGAVGLFSFFVNLLMLTFPLYLLQVFTRVLSSRSVETLIMLTVVAFGAFLIMALLEIARQKVLMRVGNRVDVGLSGAALTAGIGVALKSGGHGIQALHDVSRLRSFFSGSGILAFFDAPWTPIFLFVIYLLHPMLGIIALIGAGVLFVLALLNDRTTRKPLEEASEAQSRATKLAEAGVRNAEVVEGMGMRRGLLERWSKANAEMLTLQNRAASRTGTISTMGKFVRMVVQISVLGGGAFLVITDEIGPGAMFAAILLMARALSPVQMAISSWRDFTGARMAYKRLNDLLSVVKPRDVAMTLPAPKGAISVEKLVYFPPNGREAILKGINFELGAGESLGIIGPTAAGKSTLARLLVGAWQPSSGNVRLDGADVYTWNRDEFGRHVGYLPQDVELFEGTVEDNIARFTDANPADIVNAAKMAGAHEMILHLPDGYDTPIGEGGEMLSGGQRQTIGLARALLGPPRLIVLDEPNANLDTDGEGALLDALTKAKAIGSTLIMIAHRPSVLRSVDKLLVLNNGAVVKFGPRDEVMKGTARPGLLTQSIKPESLPQAGSGS